MAVAFVNVGAAATPGTTPLAVPLPASLVVGNLLLLHVVNKYPTNGPATPAGWNAFTNNQGLGGSGASGVDAGQVYSTVFYREVDGTESGDVAVTLTSANSSSAAISQYTKAADKVWDIAAVHGAMNTPSTSWSVTGGSVLDLTANDVAVMFSAHNSDSGALSAHALAATGIVMGALTERTDAGSTIGDDIRRWSAGGTVTSGTASAAPVYTATVSASAGDAPAGATVFVRLREVDPPPAPTPSTNTGLLTDNLLSRALLKKGLLY